MAFTERYVTSAGAGAADGTSEANAWSWATMLTTAAAGHRVNLKGSVSRTTTTDAFTNSGTSTNPIWIRGYNSTIGDLVDLGRTNGSGALVTTNFPVLSYTTGRLNMGTNPNFSIWENISFTGANTLACVTLGNDSIIRRCKILQTGTGAGSIAITNGTRGHIFDCDVECAPSSGTTCGAPVANGTGRTIACRIKISNGGTAPCVTASTGTGALLYGNQIYSGGGIGISGTSTGTAMIILNNTIYGCATDGIALTAATTGQNLIMGNMITDNTGDGIDLGSTATPAISCYNRTRDNANAYANAGDWITATQYGETSINTGTTGTSSDDYADPTNGDFTVPFASVATNANYPVYATCGALQRQSTASASTSGGFLVQ